VALITHSHSALRSKKEYTSFSPLGLCGLFQGELYLLPEEGNNNSAARNETNYDLAAVYVTVNRYTFFASLL
jgi:hypothetical protein